MAIQYLENPLLFVSSTTAAIPKGRNVRAHSRAQAAEALAPLKAQQGCFQVFDSGQRKRPNHKDHDEAAIKRRKHDSQAQAHLLQHSAATASEYGRNISFSPEVSPSLPREPYGPVNTRIDPADVLTVATFHIRRIAAMIVRTDPSRLPDVLRCRQWSCVPSALERFGKSPCLDSALICVATKLQQMTGCPVLQLTVLSRYEDALQNLRGALQNPLKHDRLDLLSTTQLLAIYEMLGSLDAPGWTQHIAGAASLVHPPENASSLYDHSSEFSFSHVAPIFTEVLLKDDIDVLEHCAGRLAFSQLVQSDCTLSTAHRELLQCLLEIPSLLVDAKPAREHSSEMGAAEVFKLMGRAHSLRDQLRNGVLANDFRSSTKVSIPGSFDILAMCLAGMVALDRLITALKPVEMRARETAADKVNELCAQLLQLELGASDSAYPATDLMSAFALSSFQQQAGYVIVLPGKIGS